MAITSAKCGIISSTHTLITTSVKENQTKNGITSANKKYYQYTQIKSLGYTNTDTPFCVGNCLEQHFPQTWKKP